MKKPATTRTHATQARRRMAGAPAHGAATF